MSDLERLHQIIDTLPPQQVQALLTLLESSQLLSAEEFARRLRAVDEEEADDETVRSVLAAEAEEGELLSHGEMKRRLSL